MLQQHEFGKNQVLECYVPAAVLDYKLCRTVQGQKQFKGLNRPRTLSISGPALGQVMQDIQSKD